MKLRNYLNVTYRSSSTLLRVSLRSGSDSPFAVTDWILTRCNLDVNDSLTINS